MKEVSCKVFEIFFRPLARKGISANRMIEGTGLALDTLRDKHERVTWGDFLAVMNNLRSHFTDDEYLDMGRMHLRGPVLRFIFVVGRLRFTPIGFYRWFNTPREGAGNQLFTCIEPTQRELSETELEVDLMVADGYEVCRDFYTITRGNFEEMPRLLGYPPAKVGLTHLERGARYHITIPSRTPFLTRLRRAIMWPFTVRAAAQELQDAHRSLQERYDQLEDAGTRLDRQATQLRTAHSVNELIQGDLDLDRTLEAVAGALVGEAGFAGVALRIAATVGDVAIEKVAERGDLQPLALTRTLEAQGRTIGELAVHPRPDADRTEREELLAFIVPTVAMALHNALSFHAVQDYRRGLERRVEERTHDLSVARDELAATVRRLEEVQASRERLFQNISHEFRTPLALILLSVDTLLAAARDRGDEGGADHLRTVAASARKLVRMVDELLLVAASREKELQVHPEPIDLQAAVTAAAAGWRLAAEAAGQTLHVDCPAGVIAVADAIALERVLANLLSNAVKFTPPGGRLAITVTPGERVEIAVTDTGIGIDDDLRGRLFGRFEQGKGGLASRGGSGIGLSLVRELLRAHGSEIEYRPNPGGGSDFRFTLASAQATARPLPAARLAPGDFGVPVAAAAVAERLEPAGPSRGTILLAEDDLALAGSIARLLGAEHTVLVAHDGPTALALAEQHHPDLLVTDVQMPGMDGFELTRRFREIPGVPPAPVLVLTARAGQADRLTGFGAGAVDYLTKPFDPGDLRARVRAQLAHRDLTRQLYDAEKLASLGALSAGLAHELRNPANGIVNAVGPLRELLPADLAAKDHPVTQLVDVMAECAEQVGYLSRQLLGFRRTGELELRRVPITDVIDRALANVSAALTGIELRPQITYSGPVRCAVPVMSQVLVNLLENAAHAAGAGGWVELATARRSGRVSLEVTDSGPGVPPALRDRIFEPFFTTKPPGQGTGLGLSTSRDLVQRHGGTLEVRPRGDRTVFVVDLPEPPEVS